MTMARALQGHNNWVELVNCAARVFWSHVELKQDDREWKFYPQVKEFNKRLRKEIPTAGSMRSALLDSEGEWWTRLANLLAEGEVVVEMLKDRTLAEAREYLADHKNDKEGKEPVFE